MNYKELLTKSEKDLGSIIFAPIPFLKIFSEGAKWMHVRLNGNEMKFNYSSNYTIFGLLKYGLASLAFLVSIFYIKNIHILLLPICVLVFYFVEIHFLFLFPLLVDSVEQPVFKNIRYVYRHGIIRTLSKVIPIGLYMLSGLIHIKEPLRKWYIGCNAILIWYKDEIRNRV